MTRLAAQEIAALDPYEFMVTIGKKVIHPGGRQSTDALLARATFDVVIAEAVTMFVDRQRAAKEIFQGQVCPGMLFDTEADWIVIYGASGLTSLTTETGPFEMMSAKGLLSDEGVARSIAIMGRVASRPANIRKMTWLMPRMAQAVPYLGYILVSGRKRS